MLGGMRRRCARISRIFVVFGRGECAVTALKAVVDERRERDNREAWIGSRIVMVIVPVAFIAGAPVWMSGGQTTQNTTFLSSQKRTLLKSRYTQKVDNSCYVKLQKLTEARQTTAFARLFVIRFTKAYSFSSRNCHDRRRASPRDALRFSRAHRWSVHRTHRLDPSLLQSYDSQLHRRPLANPMASHRAASLARSCVQRGADAGKPTDTGAEHARTVLYCKP